MSTPLHSIEEGKCIGTLCALLSESRAGTGARTGGEGGRGREGEGGVREGNVWEGCVWINFTALNSVGTEGRGERKRKQGSG